MKKSFVFFLILFSLTLSAETKIPGNKFWSNAYKFCDNIGLRLPTSAEIYQIVGTTSEWYWTNEQYYAFNPNLNKKSYRSQSTAAGFCVPLGILGRSASVQDHHQSNIGKYNNESHGLSQDQYDCIDTKKENTLFAWELYLKEHPNGVCSFEAKIKIAEFKERKEREEEIRRLEIERERKIREAAIKKAENLQWSSKSLYKMTWNDAVNYCQNLGENGYSNWRLPNIDELRTLVKNCPTTETGGACDVTNECLSQENCKNKACEGCENKGIKYSKLGDKGFLWSYSLDGNNAWYIDFTYASIHAHSNKEKFVRCVRNAD